MTARIRVREGDLFKVQLNRDVAALGIVLHVSRRFQGAIMVGFYPQLFSSAEQIDATSLGSDLIDTPNYTGKLILSLGHWPIVGSSPQLLSRAVIPTLRVAGDLYFKDDFVRRLMLSEYPAFVTMGVGGKLFVESKLRHHFGISAASWPDSAGAT